MSLGIGIGINQRNVQGAGAAAALGVTDLNPVEHGRWIVLVSSFGGPPRTGAVLGNEDIQCMSFAIDSGLIPAGSTITSATLELDVTALGGTGPDSDTTIAAEDADNPDTISQETGDDPANWTITTATTTVLETEYDDTPTFTISKDVTSIIQELVDSYGEMTSLNIRNRTNTPGSGSNTASFGSGGVESEAATQTVRLTVVIA